MRRTFTGIHIFVLACLALSFNNVPAQEDSLEQLLASSTGRHKADLLNQIAWDLRRQDPEQSIAYAKQALQVSFKEKYLPGEAFASKNLGTVELNKGQYKSSRQYLQRALMIFKEIGNLEQTGNIYNLFGLNYAERGEYRHALDMYDKSLVIFRKINDRDGEAIVTCNLGIVYYGLGNYNKAFELYHQALRIYEKLDNLTAVSNLYNNIGLIYSEQERYEQAREYYRKSLKIDHQINNLKGMLTAYNNIGTSYGHEQKSDSSLHYHFKVLALALKTNDQQALTHAQSNIGEIYMEEGQYARADSCFKLAFVTKNEMGDRLGLSIVLLNRGKLSCNLQQYNEAIAYYKNCLDIAQEIGSVKYMKEASYGLFEVYERTGDEKNAFLQFRQYQRYKDSLLNESTSNRIFSIETVYVAEKEEREKELLRKEKIIERNQRISYAMAAGFVLLLALIVVGWQRIKTKREQLLRKMEKENSELEQKNLLQEIEHNRQQLMAYTQTLLEKNQLLEELRENLEGMDLTVDQLKEKRRIEKMQELAASRIVTEDDWQRFKKLFDKVFPGFFTRLKEKYPGITTAEMRLAALIRLQLSGREIATMIGVSAESVKKTRQRIRKKMELDQEDDLEALIHSL